MKKRFLPSVIFLFAASWIALAAMTVRSGNSRKASPVTAPAGYRWTMLTEDAPFRKSYNFQLFSKNGLLWAFHPDGCYSSADGKGWKKSVLSNSIKNLAFLDYIAFNNSILGLGHFEGNIEQFTFSTQITKTTDMKTWQTIAEKSNLPERFFYYPVVFRNKIWIFGGTTDGKNGFDDAWSSADGVRWTKEADDLPFGKRYGQHFTVLNNRLFMLDNDVWVSDDGQHWSKVTDRIATETLFGYTPVVFDNKIWLLGCNRNGQFVSKVYVSGDGKNWEEQDAPWSPRGGIAATVFNGKIYMTGGKYGGFKKGTTETEFVYSNDVWMLEKIN